MSQNQSYSSYSYSSSSSSSTTNTGGGSGPTTKSYSEQIYSNDRDGTRIERRQEETGKPTYVETTEIPAGARVGGARIGGGEGGGQGQQQIQGNRVEDLTDADREYLERMEDEYAKREGGA